MRKGKMQVEQDVYGALLDYLGGIIAGTLYMSDTRPTDSMEEDAVIVAGAPGPEQWQRGRVRILIFVRDIDNNTGRPVKDIQRIQELEELAEPMIEVLHEALHDYAFDLLTAPDEGEIPQTGEHFVNIHLNYIRKTY